MTNTFCDIFHEFLKRCKMEPDYYKLNSASKVTRPTFILLEYQKRSNGLLLTMTSFVIVRISSFYVCNVPNYGTGTFGTICNYHFKHAVKYHRFNNKECV